MTCPKRAHLVSRHKERHVPMTSRQRVINALTFQPVDRIPTERDDVYGPRYTYGPGRSSGPQACGKGRYTDVWGCVWEAAEDGVCGEVKASPLRGDWSALARFQPPWDVLEQADLASVNPDCAASDKFMIPMWAAAPNPFERLQHLRGSEQLFLDLGDPEPELYRLRDLVHDYFMRQLRMWVETDIDGVHIADDWGSQSALLISPARWREFFKPLYRDYCDLAHAKGKLVVMHTDGYTADIIPDLIEIGVNAVNAQLFCMDIEQLAEQYAGRIAFWGEIDRQHLLTHGTTDEVRAAVRRVANAFLRRQRSGVVGQCFWGKDHRVENMDAVYDEWGKV
jgi:uroporphyrinogen decarboxylase